MFHHCDKYFRCGFSITVTAVANLFLAKISAFYSIQFVCFKIEDVCPRKIEQTIIWINFRKGILLILAINRISVTYLSLKSYRKALILIRSRSLVEFEVLVKKSNTDDVSVRKFGSMVWLGRFWRLKRRRMDTSSTPLNSNIVTAGTVRTMSFAFCLENWIRLTVGKSLSKYWESDLWGQFFVIEIWPFG